ncbi:restriction endonuclease subunit S [Aquimarina sp. 433]
MSYKRLGDYIHLVDNRNKDLYFDNLLGINITKNFMPSVANVTNTDLSKYKVIKKGQFAYSGMQTGRDETIRIVLYTEDKPAIISPAYSVIEVNDESKLLPEFMMMWFQRPESDRYGWFISDSSVRANLDYERLCDIEIPIPGDIEEQRKYVNLYQGLLNNQKCYEKSLEDLQLICDTYIENLIKTEKPKTLGDYIIPIEARNKDGQIKLFQGISNNKHFMTPKQIGANIFSAKVVKKGQFAYNRATTRNGEKISIAYRSGEDCAVSSAYQVFEISKPEELLPEYLLMYFKRSEFDRYARFKSEGSAHEFFDYDNMCRVKLPIPDIKIQEAIVTIYHTLETRKKLNENLKAKIQPLCPILMRGVVENIIRNPIAI